MRLNYKRLGDYIEPYNQFNEGMEVKELLGISNNKYFQNSHTNTIGIDLSTYRVVRTGQFAYNRATTRNGDKISIALRQGEDCIVSPSYRIFKSKDEEVLNSEYLMMWFRRPEFDRYARFKSHGSAHEFFEWELMCEVELPVPDIEKQREIVKEYNTIVNRINQNNQLIQKLEETAQTIYKQWFVDFEFPNKEGKPYKSSGGEMVESELGEVPKGWEVKKIGNEFNVTIGRTPPRLQEEWFNSEMDSMDWISIKDIVSCDTYIFNTNETLTKKAVSKFSIPIIPKNTTILSFKMSIGKLAITTKEMLSNEAIAHFLITNNTKLSTEYIYCFFDYFKFNKLGTTSSIVDSINTKIIKDIDIVVPNKDVMGSFNSIVKKIFEHKKNKELENNKLSKIRKLLLSKLATIEN